jgi:hypothetical protein
MATANSVFVSPGVYTSERDLSFVAQSVGVTTLGLVGETLQGPAFEPVFIRNFDEYQLYFGGTNPTKFVNTQIPKYEAAYIAKAYQEFWVSQDTTRVRLGQLKQYQILMLTPSVFLQAWVHLDLLLWVQRHQLQVFLLHYQEVVLVLTFLM